MGLTSIILVTKDRLDYTKSCIESIRRHTAAGSYELILVDNGSEDGTIDWVKAEPDIALIENGYNAGFPKGCNQGAAAAAGELLLLLNNDTLVTPGWLEGLRRNLLSDPLIAAVGPVTNSAYYWTQIPSHYTTVEEMDRFSESVRMSAANHPMEERLKLIGFCMLLRREAYEAAGGMDERFGIGNYEDDDLSLRLRLLGYKLMLCRDTFIHHYGSVSFKADSAMYLHLFARNNQLFREKWGFASSEALTIHMDMLGLLDREASLVAAGSGAGGLRFLNIGCGCGATLLSLKHRFPDAALYGVEKNEQAARIARAVGIRVFASEEPEHWGLEAGSLDGILVGDAHVCGTPEMMKRLKGLLKPGGWLIGTFLNRHYYPFMLRYLQPDNGHAQHQSAYLYSIEQVRELYADSGFASVSTLLIDDGKNGSPGKDISAEDFGFLERMANGNHPVKGRLTSSSIITLGLSAGLELAAPAEAETEELTAVAAITEELPPPVPETIPVVPAVPDQLLKEQNDVVFSGERLVINRQVKEQYTDVYEEHLFRYELASRYVRGLKVLDAACGAGYGSSLLKRAGAAEVIGVDVDAESVNLAERDYGGEGIRFEKGDVLKLPFADESYDAVVSFETIEHVDDGSAWIRESARVLKPGGLFIVSTPNRSITNPPLYFEEQPFNEYHRFEYRTSELVGELLACYDIEAMFGQNPIDDSRLLSMNWLREKVGLPLGRTAEHLLKAEGHEPLPLSRFKSCDPMYVIAVCRKKLV